MNFIQIFSGTIQTRFINTFLKKGKKFWVEKLFFKFFYFMNNFVFRNAAIQKNNYFFEIKKSKKHFFDKFKNVGAALLESSSDEYPGHTFKKVYNNKNSVKALLDKIVNFKNKAEFKVKPSELNIKKLTLKNKFNGNTEKRTETKHNKKNLFRITSRYLLAYKTVFFVLLLSFLQKSLKSFLLNSEDSPLEKKINVNYFYKNKIVVKNSLFRRFVNDFFLKNKLISVKLTRASMLNNIKKNYFYYFQNRFNPVYFLLTQYIAHHVLFQLVPFLGVRMTAVATKSNLKKKGRRRKPSGIPILLNGRAQVTKALSFFKKGFFPDDYNRKKAKLNEYDFITTFITEMSSFIITGSVPKAMLIKRKLYRSVVEFRTNYHFRWLSSKFL